MTYKTEQYMYPDVIAWLNRFLKGRFRGATIDVRDTHQAPLDEFIKRHSLQHYFTSDVWQSYDIRVDVTAFVEHQRSRGLVFVECKNRAISLSHFAQLLGYCRVAQPLLAYLISPQGVGNVLKTLILSQDRTDILEYSWQEGQQPRFIRLGRFDPLAKELDLISLLPPGAH